MSRRNNNLVAAAAANNNVNAVRRTYAQLQADTQTQQQAAAAGLAAAVRALVRDCHEPKRRGEDIELEIRFGVVDQRTHDPLLQPGGALTQSDYERVARAATQRGWTSTKPEGETLLRISESLQQQAGGGEGEEEGEGALRAEIIGAAAIEVFCRHESLDAVLEHPMVAAARRQDTVFFLRKRRLARHRFTDLEFRASLARELRVDADADAEARAMRARWSHAPKYFRHMNRAQFVAPRGDCVLLDLSIVHSNRRDLASGHPAGRGSAAAAGLFGPGARIEYEVELEVDTNVVRGWLAELQQRGGARGGGDTAAAAAADEAVAQRVLASLHRAIRTVSGALQLGSNFPVGRLERNVVLAEYMQALYADRNDSSSSMPSTTFFVGPSPVALHRRHCVASEGVAAATSDAVSILDHYCVTEKADGERALLFVSASGSVYMISGGLQVQFTGMKCTDTACRHLLLDGEYITLGHRGPLNLFAAFDLYVARDELQMGLPFDDLQYSAPAGTTTSDAELPPYRRRRMDYYTARLAATIEPKFPPAAGADPTCRLSVRSKEFRLGSSSSSAADASIFAQSKRVLDALYDYETDGLVFTPTDTAVGGEMPVFQRGGAPSEQDVRSALRNYKLRGSRDTWKRCFKWKPAEQLTNDFLVAVVGGATTATEPPLILSDAGGQITRYRKMRLLAGYNSNQAQANNQVVTRGTAFFNMLMDVAPAAPVTEADRSGLDTLAESLERGETGTGERGETGGYKPRAFVPSTPFDPDAQFCCLPLGADGVLRAENGDPIQNATIVEFRFAAPPVGRSASWGWRPIKVRHDKTSDLRSGKSEFGNAFWVANDNWFAMHYPVTPAMISGLEPIDAGADEVYYNSVRDTSLGARATNHLSDFHNKVVKRLLLRRVCGVDAQRGSKLQLPPQARTLIDFAVGKAGDMMKWQEDCRLQFVLGLDISRDNIFNAHNGAINRAQQRDVDYQKRNGRGAQLPLPRCIFLPADSSLPIRSGDGAAFAGTLDRGAHRIVRAIFGDEPAPPQTLSPRFERVAAGSAMTESGFDVGSIQFALHYMWESPAKLHGLLRNASECVRLGGLFTGTCFDGVRLFDKLRAYQYAGPDAKAGPAVVASGAAAAPHYRVLSRRSDSIGRVLLAVAKKYTAREFVAGPQSIGMCVSVYMESIDQALDEYLVHLDYLDSLMDVYGFEPLSEAEMVALGFPASGEGGRRSFEKLFDGETYNVLEREARRKMSEEEREISFLNSLFVYRKKRSLAPERLDALHREYVLNAPPTAAAAADGSKKNKKRGAAEQEKEKQEEEEYGGRGWAEFTGKFVRVANAAAAPK